MSDYIAAGVCQTRPPAAARGLQKAAMAKLKLFKLEQTFSRTAGLNSKHHRAAHASSFFLDRTLTNLLVRAILASLGSLLFYSTSWLPLQMLIARCLSAIVNISTSYKTSVSSVVLSVSNYTYMITAECTYADLFLICIPFLLRPHSHYRTNLFILIAFAFLIICLTLARILIAIVLHNAGITWCYVHDYPDYLIYYSLILTVVYRSILETRPKSRLAT